MNTSDVQAVLCNEKILELDGRFNGNIREGRDSAGGNINDCTCTSPLDVSMCRVSEGDSYADKGRRCQAKLLHGRDLGRDSRTPYPRIQNNLQKQRQVYLTPKIHIYRGCSQYKLLEKFQTDWLSCWFLRYTNVKPMPMHASLKCRKLHSLGMLF